MLNHCGRLNVICPRCLSVMKLAEDKCNDEARFDGEILPISVAEEKRMLL